jgi:twinkle protein
MNIHAGRHGQPGYYSLRDVPQRGSIRDITIGTGYSELDEIWKLYPGQFTICTGIAGHGKSTLLLNVIANVARQSNVASFMYVPENEGHVREKMKLIWGDPTVGTGSSTANASSNRPSRKLMTAVKTLEWVLDRALVAVRRDNVGLLLIDPWNELERAKDKDHADDGLHRGVPDEPQAVLPNRGSGGDACRSSDKGRHVRGQNAGPWPTSRVR